MLIFKDKATKKELFSDAYNFEKIFDDVLYKVESMFGKEDVEDDDSPIVNQIICKFDLQPLTITKKEFSAMIKVYMKYLNGKVSEENPDRVKAFQSGAKEAVKFFLGEFKELEFYKNDFDNQNAMIVALKFEGETPYVYFWGDATEAEKY